MGCLCGKNAPEIDQHLKEENDAKSKFKQLLLIGTGSSGKSTLFKQIKCIKGEGFTQEECAQCLQIIRMNCAQTIFTLLKRSEQLYLRDKQLYRDCFVDPNDTDISNVVIELYRWWTTSGQYLFDPTYTSTSVPMENTTLSKNIPSQSKLETSNSQTALVIPNSSDEKIVEEKSSNESIRVETNRQGGYNTGFPTAPTVISYDWETLERVGKMFKYVWNLKGVRHTFHERESFSLPDNMDFYLNKIEDIMKADYICTNEDCLKVSSRTIGWNNYEFTDQGYKFNIFDLGGQRSERRKWFHHFSGIDALIFVASLNHYATPLFEDGAKNAMHESLELFQEVANSKYFRLTGLILFLNKEDLYRERIRDGKSLSLCFSSKVGWQGEEWEESDFDPNYKANDPSAKSEEEYFLAIAEAGIEFITRQYIKQLLNPDRSVFTHVTTAIETQATRSVFWDVQNFVIRLNMQTGGMV